MTSSRCCRCGRDPGLVSVRAGCPRRGGARERTGAGRGSKPNDRGVSQIRDSGDARAAGFTRHAAIVSCRKSSTADCHATPLPPSRCCAELPAGGARCRARNRPGAARVHAEGREGPRASQHDAAGHGSAAGRQRSHERDCRRGAATRRARAGRVGSTLVGTGRIALWRFERLHRAAEGVRSSTSEPGEAAVSGRARQRCSRP